MEMTDIKCRSKNETSAMVLVPSRSSFQKQTYLNSTKKASVGYLPEVTGSPTSFNVIECVMDKTIECINYLNLNYIFLEVSIKAFLIKSSSFICIPRKRKQKI